MQVITHQFITFGCDHGELECVGRLVFINIGDGLSHRVTENVKLTNQVTRMLQAAPVLEAVGVLEAQVFEEVLWLEKMEKWDYPLHRSGIRHSVRLLKL